MQSNLQHQVLKASVTSMIIELTNRIGDENPYLNVSLDELDVADLAFIKRNLHEILYSPPVRNK